MATMANGRVSPDVRKTERSVKEQISEHMRDVKNQAVKPIMRYFNGHKVDDMHFWSCIAWVESTWLTGIGRREMKYKAGNKDPIRVQCKIKFLTRIDGSVQKSALSVDPYLSTLDAD